MSFLLILVASGCASREDLYPDARCSSNALADKEQDAPKVVALLPEGVSEVSGSLQEDAVTGYRADCLIKGDEFPARVRGYASFTGGKEEDPRELFTENLPGGFGKGLRPIKAAGKGAIGVSGSGSAQIWAPCTMKKGIGGPEGFMLTSVMAKAAPEANSRKQRQNAADLALSLLRYASGKCDKAPELPRSVSVT